MGGSINADSIRGETVTYETHRASARVTAVYSHPAA